MRQKNKNIVWIMIFAFFFNVVIGVGMFTPATSFAYDNPPKDHGHEGPNPKPPKNTEKPSDPCVVSLPAGSEIFLEAGDYSYSCQDLFIPGRGLSLEVIRTHDSQDMYDGPFGYAWKFNYDIRLLITTSGEQEIITLRRGDGVRLNFTQNDDGSYSPPTGKQDFLMKDTDGSYKWYEYGCSSCGAAGTCYHFDGTGRLLKIVDSNGNEMTFGYDTAGKLTLVTDASGRTLTISYSPNNKISTITDPAGRTFSYNYDDQSNLTSYTDPDKNTNHYTYDSSHNLTSIVDAKGITIHTMQYDEYNRLTRYTKFGGAWQINYDRENNTTYVVDANDKSWTYVYNDTGQPLTTTGPLRYYTGKTWDDNFNLKKRTNKRWFYTTTYQYDERGNRTAIIDALGNTTTYTFHETFNKVTGIKITGFTGSLERTTAYEYDEHANLIKITDASGDITMTYDQYGQMATTTNANGTTTYTYDNYGNQKSITDALENTTSMEYDILGNLTKIIDEESIITFSYDILGNLTSLTDQKGRTTRYTYDVNGNMQTITDAEGNKTRHEYDNFNRLKKATDAEGNVTEYTYDYNGNQTSIKDAKNNITSYEYDSLDRLIKITYPNTSTETYAYDEVGNVISKTDRNGNTITYTYDELDRLTVKTYPDSTQATYVYDDLGKLISVTNSNSTINHIYNELDRVIQVTQDGKNIAYEYDNIGNKTKVTYTDGTYIKYTYDALNRMDQIKDSTNQVIADYTYDNLGRRTQLDLINGTKALYQYNKTNRLTSLTNRKTSTQAIISSFTYSSYDKVGNRKSMTTPGGTHNYTYDKIYQITNVDYPGSHPFSDMTYNYDAVGNRTTTINGGTIAYSTNNMNQYTNVGSSTYTYDANGNLINDGINTYTYDYENQLTQIITPTGTISFAYDPQGRRISKIDSTGTTKYVYDNNQVIEEYNGIGTLMRKFVYGPGIDEPIMMDNGTNQYYYHLDGLGSVTEITDSSGAIKEKYTYDVYGKPIINDASNNILSQSSISNPYLFTGRRFDPETGLYYYRARYYSPTIGRFLSQDPIGFAGGDLNLYRYVGNNPVNLVDPEGKGIIMSGIAVILVLGGAFVLVYKNKIIPIEEEARKNQEIAADNLGEEDSKKYEEGLEALRKANMAPNKAGVILGREGIKIVWMPADTPKIVAIGELINRALDYIMSRSEDDPTSPSEDSNCE